MADDEMRGTNAQAVNLTDRIPWQWYLVTAVLPILGAIIGFIAGIVFMAQSKIGPALALWATSFLATAVWWTIGWTILLGYAFEEASNSVDPPAVVDSSNEAEEADPQPDPGAADEARSSDLETTGEDVEDGPEHGPVAAATSS